MKKGKISILEANVMYLVAALLLITIGSYVQTANVKLGLIITEYILVLLPVIIFLKVKDISVKKFLRLKKLRLKHIIIIIAVTLLCYPVALFFNISMLTTLSHFGLEIKSPPIPKANNLVEYINLIFIIAISAGICEEVFFRGLISKVYEKKYKATGVVITATLFGIFHFNLQNLLGPIVLGLVFGYLVYITDSIYAGIVGHITNNGFAVTITYLINILQKRINGYSEIPSQDVMPNTLQLFIAAIMLGVLATITGLIAYWLIRIIKKDMQKDSYRNENIQYQPLTEQNYTHEIIIKKKRYSFVKFIPILVVIIIYIIISILQYSI